MCPYLCTAIFLIHVINYNKDNINILNDPYSLFGTSFCQRSKQVHSNIYRLADIWASVCVCLCLCMDSCLMQLLTATLLLPGAISSSDISTQPRERTAKHCKGRWYGGKQDERRGKRETEGRRGKLDTGKKREGENQGWMDRVKQGKGERVRERKTKNERTQNGEKRTEKKR